MRIIAPVSDTLGAQQIPIPMDRQEALISQGAAHRTGTGTDDESDDGDWCVSLQLEFPSQRAFLVERRNGPSGEQRTGQDRDVMGRSQLDATTTTTTALDGSGRGSILSSD